MNQFLSTSTGGDLLKEYYPIQTPMSALSHALKKRRRKRKANWPGMEPNDMDMIESSNMGYSDFGRGRGLL